MLNGAKRRIQETYRQTAKIYDIGVSERLGDSKWGIESLTRLLLRDIEFQENPVVLDLACGTGLSTFQLIEWLHGEGVFHGVDLSPEMITRAGENAEKLGYEIDFRVGDAEKLEYPDDSFDVVISNMSFQMFPHKLQALKEIYRVLRPGGVVGLLFGAGDHLLELVLLCREVAGSHPELTDFNQSVSDIDWMHIDIDETQRLFYEAGLRRPQIHGYHRVMHVNPRRFWESNPYPAIWKTHIPLDTRDRVESEIVGLMETRSGDRGFRLNWYTIQAYGVKPR
jgi:ubiquinone/menaquinone biosynthesis C-methylase UbiE